MDPDELYTTTMDPEKRHLVQLKTEDFEKTIKLYDTLMGKSAELRRSFILNHKLKSEVDDLYEDDSIDIE